MVSRQQIIVTANDNAGSDAWNAQNGTYKFTCAGYPQGWSADSSMVLTRVKPSATAPDENACIWNINSQQFLHTLRDVIFGSRCAWASHGSHLILGEVIWDAASGQKVTELQFNAAADYFAWSPNGKYIAISYEDDTVHIWKAI